MRLCYLQISQRTKLGRRVVQRLYQTGSVQQRKKSLKTIIGHNKVNDRVFSDHNGTLGQHAETEQKRLTNLHHGGQRVQGTSIRCTSQQQQLYERFSQRKGMKEINVGGIQDFPFFFREKVWRDPFFFQDLELSAHARKFA